MKNLTKMVVKKITKFSVFVRVTHPIYYTDFSIFCQQKRLSIFSHTLHKKRSAKALLELFDLKQLLQFCPTAFVEIKNAEAGKQAGYNS